MTSTIAIAGSLAALTFSCGAAAAHEFWLSTEVGVLDPGAPIIADLMVGVLLQGVAYPFLPDNIVRFDVTARGATAAVTGLPGDLPAMRRDAGAGLHVIAHQTAPFRTTHESWPEFQRFVREEGFPEIEARHLARQLPLTGFNERYIRYVKALVQAGPVVAGDEDFRVGMAYELVAEANPYRGGAELPVRLYWDGEPAADAQIAILRDDGDVTRDAVRTDAQGRARVPLGPGFTLLSAVRIEPVENAPVVWLSHWAALSFRIDTQE